MALKLIKCTTRNCPTPNIFYDDDIPPTEAIASQIRAVKNDLMAKSVERKTINPKNIKTDIFSSDKSEIKKTIQLSDIINLIAKSLDDQTIKTNVQNDYKVVFCDTGHTNYIID